MHSQDILQFLKQHKGFATVETLNRYYPNTPTEIITKAVYLYLREKRNGVH